MRDLQLACGIVPFVRPVERAYTTPAAYVCEMVYSAFERRTRYELEQIFTVDFKRYATIYDLLTSGF